MDTNDENKKRPHLMWALVVIALVILGFFLLRPNNVIIKGKIIADQNGEIQTGYYDFRIKVSSKDVEKVQKTYFVTDHTDIQVDSQGRFEIVQEIPRGIDKSVAADMVVCYSSAVKSRPDGVTRDTDSIEACINSEPEIYDTNLCSIDFSSTSPNNLLTELIGVRQVLVSGICNGIPQESPATGSDEDEQTLAFNPLTNSLTITNGNTVTIPTSTGTTVQNISNSFPSTNVTNNVNGITQIDTGNGLMGGPITTTGTIEVNAPTCAGTDKLQWNGTAFICSPDLSAAGVTTVTASGPILSSGGATPNISLAACALGESYVHDGANWVCQTAPTAITVQNGLTDIGGGIVELGGANPLLHNTDIASAGFNLNVTGTGRVGIGTNTPEFKLDIGNDGVNGGGIIARGTFGSGAALTTNGAGERLIWDPSTGAFRAGGVSGAAWDLANIGAYSFAAGQDNLVSGSNSAGFGGGNTVTGNNSFASGTGVTVAGNFSAAFGLATSAGGNFSSAFGLLSNASGSNSFAAGSNAAASNTSTIAMGTNVTASGPNAISMGSNSTATADNTITIGNFNNSLGFGSTAIGFNNQLNASNGYALGYQNTQAIGGDDAYMVGLNNTANAGNAVMMGVNNVVNGSTSQAIGFQNTANGLFSNAFGRFSSATGDYSSTFGTNLVSQGYAQTTLGIYNEASGTSGAFVPTDEGLIFGNGTGLGSESNAFSISWQGRTTLYGTNAIVPVSPANAGSIYFDTNTQTFQCSENNGAYFGCFGAGGGVTDINGESGSITLSGNTPITVGNVGPSFSIGLAACLENQNYVYTGGNWVCTEENLLYYDESTNPPDVAPLASGANAVAIGDSTTAAGNYSTAIGWATSALGFRSQAYGMANTASGTAVNSQLFGFNNTIDTFDTVSVGWSNTSAVGGEINIFGRGNTGNGDDSSLFGFGNTSSATFSNQYLFGRNLTSGASDTYTYGNAITNNTAGSLMMGPNASDVITILATGEMGFGNIDPTSRVDISGALTMRGMAAPGLSPLGQGRIYFDSTVNEFLCSEDNGAYFDCFGASGVTSVTAGLGMVNSGTPTAPILDVQAINGVRIDATNDAVMFGGPVNSGLGPLIEDTQLPQSGFTLAFLGNSGTDLFGIGTNATGTNLNERLDVVGNIENIADDTVNPEVISTVNTLNTPTSIQVVGNKAFITAQTNNILQSIDISTPSTMTVEYTINTNTQQVNDIVAGGRYIYATGQASGLLQVIDTYNNGVTVNTVKGTLGFTGFQIPALALSGNYLAVLLQDANPANNDFLAIVDVSNPSYPREVGRVTLGINTNPTAIDIQGGIAYITFGVPSNQLRAIDINTPEAPTQYPLYSAPICPDATSVDAYGRYAVVGCFGTAAIVIMDIANPNIAAPAPIASFAAGGTVTDLEVTGRYLFATLQSTNELRMWDIGVPSSPALVGFVTTGGTGPNSLDISGRHVYVTNSTTNTVAAIAINGIETTSILAHSVEAGGLNVDGDTNLFGRVNIATSASIGSNVDVGGDLAVSGQVSTLINSSITPARVGNLSMPAGNNTDMVINGSYAYILDQALNTLSVVNVSSPTAPVVVGAPILAAGSPRTISIAGRYLFVGTDSSTLLIYDLTNPTLPVLLTTYTLATPTGVRDIIATDKFLYVTGIASNSVFVLDISNIRSPRLVSTTPVCADPTTLTIQDKYLAVGCSQAVIDNVQIFDIINPTLPTPVSTISVSLPGLVPVTDIDFQGNTLYVTTVNGFALYNVAIITAPVNVFGNGSFFGGGGVTTTSLTVSGRFAYVTLGSVTPIWFVVDVSNTTLPRVVATPFTAASINNRTLILSGKYIYTLNNNIGNNSIEIFDVNGVETSNLVAHSGQISQLVVQNDANILGNLTVAGGANFAQNVSVNGDQTVNGQLNVTGKNPVSISTTAAAMGPSAVATSGRYLYLGATTGGRIYDVSDPTAPLLVSSPAIPTNNRAIIVGQYLYTSFGTTFTLSSLANPFAPVVLSNTALTVANRAFDIQGKYAYMMKSNGELDVIDISSTQTMNIVSSTLISAGSINWIEVQGQYAYISHAATNSIYIVNISNPLAPTIVSSLPFGTTPTRMVVRDSFMYVNSTTTMYTVNIADPATPVIVNTIPGFVGAAIGLEISGKMLYVSGTAGLGLRIYDISTPSTPVFAYTAAAGNPIPNVKVLGRYIYAGDTAIGGLRVLDAGGAYIQQLEASGVETDTVVARGDLTANTGIFKNGISVTNSMNVIGDSNVRGKLTVGQNNIGPSSGTFQEGTGYAFSAMAAPNSVSTASAIAAITNLIPTDSINNNVLRLSMGTPAIGGNVNSRFVRFFAGLSTGDTGGTAVGSISLNGAAGISYNTSGADFGEYYTIADNAQVGEIVAVTRNGNVKGVTGDKILGVISDTAGFVGNSVEYTNEGEMPADKKIVGLLGQMKVKVTGENGVIEQGDFVSLSSTAGFGMKATQNGMVLGKAMENGACVDAGCTETLMVAVQPTWYVPELEGLLMGESDTETEEEPIDVPVSSLSMNDVLGYLSTNVLEVLTANTLTVNSRLNVNGSLYLGANNTGKAFIGAGQTSVQVTFLSAFESIPNVFLTQNSFVEGKFRVTNVTTTGFTIELENIQPSDVEFTWLSSGTL